MRLFSIARFSIRLCSSAYDENAEYLPSLGMVLFVNLVPSPPLNTPEITCKYLYSSSLTNTSSTRLLWNLTFFDLCVRFAPSFRNATIVLLPC